MKYFDSQLGLEARNLCSEGENISSGFILEL